MTTNHILRRAAALALSAASMSLNAGAQTTAAAAPAIHLSQIGFLPQGPKVAIVTGASASTFAIVSAERGDTVLRGSLTRPKPWALSGEENVRRADFGTLTRPGRYHLVVPGIGTSPEFEIGTTRLHELAVATLKGFYYQRTAIPLEPAFAGKWARAAGHPDTAELDHPSSASPSRPAVTRISSPLGRYDAGDNNK